MENEHEFTSAVATIDQLNGRENTLYDPNLL